LVFKAVNDDAVIAQIFKAAGFTYGPLLGLYAFGLLTRRKVKDAWVGLVCMGAVLLSCTINWNAEEWFGSKIGFEILIYNGGLTYLGLWIISRKSSSIPENA
ncbi:sodium:solute symporter, partial [Verrucomicrobia bacterium]|nr:sodium:solute symporter [Verrucomicrobiota bacterium]